MRARVADGADAGLSHRSPLLVVVMMVMGVRAQNQRVAQMAQEYTERRRRVLQDPFCFSEQQHQGSLAMSMGTREIPSAARSRTQRD
jgi:hypothetical protein